MDTNNREILINVKVDNAEALQKTEALKKKYSDLNKAVETFSKTDLNQININELEIALNEAKRLFTQLSKNSDATVGDLKNVSSTIKDLGNKIAEVKDIDIKVNSDFTEFNARLDDLKNLDLPNISLDGLNFELEKSQRLFQDIFNADSVNSDELLSSVASVMDNINQQLHPVDIPVEVDTNSAKQSTTDLQNRFKTLTNIALSFDEIDFDNSTIGELQDHLKQANLVLKELKSSGLASEQQLADMNKTVSKLKGTVSGLKFENAFKGFEGTVLGIVGTAQIFEGSLKSLGIESEETSKSIEKMLALMNLKDGVESIGKSITAMRGLAVATDGTTSSTKLLGLGLKGLGIGLVVTAVMYLINNWNTLYETIKEFIPAIDSVGGKFKNMSAIAEGVGKAVVGFIVRPIQSAIKAFNLLKDGDWKSAGKEILTALNPLERINNVVKDFNSGFNQGVIKKEATDNIKSFNDATEKSIKLLEAQDGKEKEIFALKKKMWSNEITQLKKKNKVLSDADQKRVEELTELLEVEGVKHNKFLTDAGKASADAFKQGMDDFKNSMVEINKIIADVGKSERQKELEEIDKHYQELINKAKKYKQDISAIEQARDIKRAEVNKKFDTEDAEKELEKTELKGSTALLKAKTGNEEKTIADVSRIAEAELKNLKETYDKELVLAKDNKDELENLEAQYANDVYNINKSLADKIKAIKDKELQDAKDKVNTISETNVLNIESEIIKSEKDLPQEDGTKPLSDEQIKLVLDNVDKLHNAKLEQLKSNYEAERLLHAENAEELARIDAQYNNDVISLERDSSKQKIDIKKDEKEKKEALQEMELSSIGSAFSAIGALAEESSIFGKSLATADAIIQTYLGANKAIGQGGIFGIASAVGIIATGLANVKKIMSTKVSNKEGSSNSIQAPIINTTQLQPRATQDVRVVDNTAQTKQPPMKTYVVYKDLKTKEEKENFYDSLSSY